MSLIKEGLHLYDFLFWRYLLAAALLLPFLNTKRDWQDVYSKAGLWIIILSAVFYEGSTIFISMQLTTLVRV